MREFKISLDIDVAEISSFLVFRDLKRDVAKKLEKLEKRTQRAIVELVHVREYCDCMRWI